jgi:predicted helicase
VDFIDVLKILRSDSYSEKDKGDRFEKMMKAFLPIYPLYSDILKKVWLWQEFPYRNDISAKDTGIDLVALTEDDEYWAIQCKCYAENKYMDKASVDSFLATSGKLFGPNKESFVHRLWLSTTDHWSHEAENVFKAQKISVSRLGFDELKKATVDWEALYNGVTGQKLLLPKKTPREHQLKAINNFHEHFKANDRGRLIMACGTDKTYTALKIAEKETNNNGLILFLVPSIALLGQTLLSIVTNNQQSLCCNWLRKYFPSKALI